MTILECVSLYVSIMLVILEGFTYIVVIYSGEDRVALLHIAVNYPRRALLLMVTECLMVLEDTLTSRKHVEDQHTQLCDFILKIRWTVHVSASLHVQVWVEARKFEGKHASLRSTS